MKNISFWPAMLVFTAALAVSNLVVGKLTKDYYTKQTIDNVFEFCYNSRAMIVDERTGRAIACMGIRQTQQEREDQLKLEKELDKKNEV